MSKLALWLLLSLSAFLIGVGVGGLIRPAEEYSAVVVLHVVADATPAPQGKTNRDAVVILDSTPPNGCVRTRQGCVCDSPYGAVRIPKFVECDVVRWSLYQAEQGEK